MTKKKQAPNKILWIFAIGQLGWSILSAIMSNWLVYFYQPSEENIEAGQTLFITQSPIFLGLTVIGLIAAFGRIFDAVTDPLVAGFSDRCKSRLGRRIPFMRYAAIPFSLVTILVFISPVQSKTAVNGVSLFVTSMLFYLCMTLYCTPYNALIPELGKTQNARINLSTYISVTFFFGTALAYLVPNIAGFFEDSLGHVNSFRLTVAILSAIACLCMLFPAFLIDEKEYADTTPSQTPAFKSLVKTFRNSSFRTFVASDIMYWIALTMFQTGLPFYITVLMKLDDGMSFVFFALMTVLSLILYPFVNILAKKLGKKKLVMFAFVFFSFVFLITAFCGTLGIVGIVWGAAISALASIPMAILGILPQAIVADIAESDSIETKENREGMFYAARTFAFKLGQSIAMLVFTSVAKIGKEGYGYRLSAIIAALLCLGGGIIFLFYNEKKVFSVIEKNKSIDKK